MNATARLARMPFPFSALVGQQRLQQALLLAAVDPGIGGVLVSGPRGTAKSTAARALAQLLPEGQFVTLPLGASEEQLIGTLDLGHVLKQSEVRFAPGLLARAHQGVLYVDEVNLLPDHLVDQLLDVAASGVNVVERDGVSHQHEARFVLVGTMNPEEGELRPQLLDRFGLSLALENCTDAAQRQAIVKARLAFDNDPVALCTRFATEQDALTRKVRLARGALSALSFSDAVHERVSHLCLAAAVDGVRADLVMLRAARALAALQCDAAVVPAHVDTVAELVLHHRRQAPPNAGRQADGHADGDGNANGSGDGDGRSAGDAAANNPWGALPPALASAAAGIAPVKGVRPLPTKKSLSHRQAAAEPGQGGNRWQAPRFAASLAAPHGRPGSLRIHWTQTLAAKGSQPFAPSHLRWRAQQAHAGVLHCFVLDCSASMLHGRQLALAKGVLLRLLQRAYQARAEVALVCFAAGRAEVRLQPARARPWSEAWIRPIAGGGGTPLSLGMARAGQLLAHAARRRPAQQRWLWLLSDGRSTEQPPRPPWADAVMVVDFERQAVALGRCRQLARGWEGEYLVADALMG